MKIGATNANLAAQKMPDYPSPDSGGCGDPGDTYTPSRGGGPDDTTDPDFGNNRGGGGWSGPDGSYGGGGGCGDSYSGGGGYDEYH